MTNRELLQQAKKDLQEALMTDLPLSAFTESRIRRAIMFIEQVLNA